MVSKKINEIVTKHLSMNQTDEVLSLHCISDSVSNQYGNCLADLRQYFGEIQTLKEAQIQSSESHDAASNSEKKSGKEIATCELVNYLFQQKHLKKQLIIYRVLTKLVALKLTEAKFACDYILKNLSGTTSIFIWCKSIEYVRRIIPTLDYKSCRDVFKVLLETITRISGSSCENLPNYSNDTNLDDEKATDTKVETLYEIVSYVLDASNYFLPRYLAINEVKTVLSFGKDAYHERFHRLFTNYIDSFLPLTQLLAVSGRDCLLPIIGFSNLATVHSVWRFTSEQCKFNTKPLPLPFYKIQHISKQQFDIFAYILRQSTPQYLALQLVGLTPRTKSPIARCQGLEEVFVFTIIDTMKRTEQMRDQYEVHRIWNNLLNSLLSLSINQYVSLTNILALLLAKLKSSRFNANISRDWLMWYFLQIITWRKQKVTEFTSVIDIYDLFYKDEEPLQVPDMNDFQSCVKFAPISIWIHFNKKSEVKTFMHPNVLKNQAELIEETMDNQNYQDRVNVPACSYSLPICLNAYSGDIPSFQKLFNYLLVKIGKGLAIPTGTTAHSLHSTSQTQPLSMSNIKSLSYNNKLQIIQLISFNLTKSSQVYLPSSLIDTYARLFINESDALLKLFQQVWNGFIPMQSTNSLTPVNPLFYQNFNILLEILAFRIHNMGFSYRLQFIANINSLYLPNQRNESFNILRYPQIYINSQCALLKLIQGFSIADFYELLNSIIGNVNYSVQCLINVELEEVNKALVLLIARAIHLTSSDLHPKYEHKERDEILQGFLKHLLEKTPIFFPTHVVNSFPKILQNYFSMRTDLVANQQNRVNLKRSVDEDLRKFKEVTFERQVQDIFQNQSQNTFLCVFFNILLEDPNMSNSANHLSLLLHFLNTIDLRKLTPHIRTLCDYIVLEMKLDQSKVHDSYNAALVKMINTLNLFTLDRFFFILISRSFDESDIRFALRIVYQLFKNKDFDTKFKDFNNLWNTTCPEGEWNPSFQTQFISAHSEKFNYDGLRQLLNFTPRDTYLLNYYGNTCLRLVQIIDLIFYRYIESNALPKTFDVCFELFSPLYKHHPNPVLFAYTTLMYYNSKFEALPDAIIKKRRILLLVNASFKPDVVTFTELFKTYLNSLQNAASRLAQGTQITNAHVQIKLNQPTLEFIEMTDIGAQITEDYYFSILQRLVNRMLDKEDPNYPSFDTQKSEFDNPACHVLYMILIELISLPIFTKESTEFTSKICTNIIDLFFNGRFNLNQSPLDSEFIYWINAAGLIIANLPESYWCSIYTYLLQAMTNNQILNSTNIPNLLDYFDLYLASEKQCIDEITILIVIFHAILTHSNAIHFQYFVKFLMETLLPNVKTEAHFLFVCKLIGPFLSKIHIENTSLLIDLANCLYEMVYTIDISNETLIYIDTISNFFYYLKYRHIGESTKGKIQSIIPKLKPDLRKYFKYIISDFSHNQPLDK